MPEGFQDLTKSTFESVDLTGSTFRRVYLNDVTIQNADLVGAKLQDVDLIDVEITGDLRNVTVNGVEITDYVEAELNRRHPGREKIRPSTAAGFREGWDMLEQR